MWEIFLVISSFILCFIGSDIPGMSTGESRLAKFSINAVATPFAGWIFIWILKKHW